MSGEAINPIYVGYSWSQDFTLDAGAIEDQAVVWVNLRTAGYPEGPSVGRAEFARVEPLLLRLALSANQTQNLRPGTVEGFLMKDLGQSTFPLNIRLTVPVEAVP